MTTASKGSPEPGQGYRAHVAFEVAVRQKGAPMYVPRHFEESRPEQLHSLIAEHPLGILVTQGSGGLDANHLPFELETR